MLDDANANANAKILLVAERGIFYKSLLPAQKRSIEILYPTQFAASVLHRVRLAFMVDCHRNRDANPSVKTVCCLVEKGKERR